MEVVARETTRGRDPADNLEEVDVDDVVEDVDDGIGERTDRPNAGEGELNRTPLSLARACDDEGWGSQILITHSREVHQQWRGIPPLDSSSPDSITRSNAETMSFEDAEVVDIVDFLFPIPNLAVSSSSYSPTHHGVVQTIPPLALLIDLFEVLEAD
jgi:hypothetical protein